MSSGSCLHFAEISLVELGLNEVTYMQPGVCSPVYAAQYTQPSIRSPVYAAYCHAWHMDVTEQHQYSNVLVSATPQASFLSRFLHVFLSRKDTREHWAVMLVSGDWRLPLS